MFYKKIVMGIGFYTTRIFDKINRSITLFKCNYLKNKILNNLNINTIDNLCISQCYNMAKFVLEVFGFSKVKPFKGCCLEYSCKAIVVSKNNENYLIIFSNNQHTLCYNKVAMCATVGKCDYKCVKAILVANYEFVAEFCTLAKNLNIVLVGRENLITVLEHFKSVKRFRSKERLLTNLVCKTELIE